MPELDVSLLDDFDKVAYHVVEEVRNFFELWKSGKVYIPKSALRAMGRRYLALRDTEQITMQQVYEFGRLYAFFCLLYPPDGEMPTVAGMAIDYCNLLTLREVAPLPHLVG
jgi:hypothetical protein